MKLSAKCFCVIGIAIIVLSFAVVSYASSSNTWTVTNIPKDRCIDHAVDAARMGPHKSIKITGQSVFIDSGPYHTCVRCIPEHGIVFIYTYGPDSGECSRINNHMKEVGRWTR